MLCFDSGWSSQTLDTLDLLTAVLGFVAQPQDREMGNSPAATISFDCKGNFHIHAWYPGGSSGRCLGLLCGTDMHSLVGGEHRWMAVCHLRRGQHCLCKAHEPGPLGVSTSGEAGWEEQKECLRSSHLEIEGSEWVKCRQAGS